MRTITLGIPHTIYPKNALRNQRYTWYTFPFVVLRHQFKYFFNIYFFTISFSQLFSRYSVSPLISNVIPWSMVLFVNLLKEAIDDYKRYKRDVEANSQMYSVVRKRVAIKKGNNVNEENIKRSVNVSEPNNIENTNENEKNESKNINESIIKNENDLNENVNNVNENDLIENTFTNNINIGNISSSTDTFTNKSENISVVLDLGDNDYEILSIKSSDICVGDLVLLTKNRRVPADCVLLSAPDNTVFIRTDQLDGETDWKSKTPVYQNINDTSLFTKHCIVDADLPHKDIYSFVGTITDDITLPLDYDNMLWMNTVLASTSAICACIYTGTETRAVMNTCASKQKLGLIDEELNFYSKFLFVLSLSAALLFSLMRGITRRVDATVIRFLVLFSSVVPISLKVSIDCARYCYVYFIQKDVECVVRNSSIPEELGRISYLLSDKTGTLTCNVMEMKKVSMGTLCYTSEMSGEIQEMLHKRLKGEMDKGNDVNNGEVMKGINNNEMMKGCINNEGEVKGCDKGEVKGINNNEMMKGCINNEDEMKGCVKGEVKGINKGEVKGISKDEVKSYNKDEVKGFNNDEEKGIYKSELKGINRSKDNNFEQSQVEFEDVRQLEDEANKIRDKAHKLDSQANKLEDEAQRLKDKKLVDNKNLEEDEPVNTNIERTSNYEELNNDNSQNKNYNQSLKEDEMNNKSLKDNNVNIKNLKEDSNIKNPKDNDSNIKGLEDTTTNIKRLDNNEANINSLNNNEANLQRLNNNTNQSVDNLVRRQSVYTSDTGSDRIEDNNIDKSIVVESRGQARSGGKKKKRDITNKVYDLLIGLSLCHNVTPVTDNGITTYQASSPDEVAIVKWAESVGVKLVERSSTKIVLSDISGVHVFRILFIFPFTSDSKRMGVVIEHPDKEIYFYQKGADVVMNVIVKSNDWLEEETDNMAREGLRTLIIGCKKLDTEEYKYFCELWNKATANMERRAEEQSKAVAYLEHDLDILGLTGVEDKLQDGVKQSLENLRNAGIKVWMLTGDKIETATCIAISSKLFTKTGSIKQVVGVQKREEAYAVLQDLQANENDVQKYNYLIVDGASIATLLKEFPDQFMEGVSHLEAVVFCRCSPTQKADIANLLRQVTKLRVACIGDGGNDVSMITAADVGIGIVGKEGKQASLAADFSLERFKDVCPLFLWHGRNCYKGTSKLAHLIIHRGTIISVMQAIFCSLLRFLPFTLYQGTIIVFYVTLYTCLPVLTSILSTDSIKETVLKFPELYKELNKSKKLSFRAFATWNIISFYQGAMIILLSCVFFKRELHSIISITFSSLIVNELLMVILSVDTVTQYLVVSEILSLFFYVISFKILKYELVMPCDIVTFMWKVGVINVVAISFTVVQKIYNKLISPSITAKLAPE